MHLKVRKLKFVLDSRKPADVTSDRLKKTWARLLKMDTFVMERLEQVQALCN